MLFSLLFSACAPTGDDGEGALLTPTSSHDAPASTEAVTCARARDSVCSDDGAAVRGVAYAGAEGPTTGDLVVYLTHVELGEEADGGFYHTSVVYEDVDLASGPKKFQVDMCEGGEMWAAEYGDYNLLVILDQDGDNEPASFDSDRTPDPGEPSARVSPITLDPGQKSPCFDDVVLDCMDGKDCTAY